LNEAETPVQAPDLHAHNLVIDCANHDVVVPFWTAALGWEPVRVNEQFGLLRAPRDDRAAFDILFQKVPEPKVVKNRVHIDINIPDGAEMARLQRLGARVLQEIHDAEGRLRWTVMADPEGNEFCAFLPRE